MENMFIKYLRQGRILSLDDLKRCYRQVVMKTHPDAVGSDELVEQYIEYGRQYAEARGLIEKQAAARGGTVQTHPVSYRLRFYREFYQLERIDKPYAFNKHYHSAEEIAGVRESMDEYLSKWRPERFELHTRAHQAYDRIKQEKPRGPYRKHALLYNMSPVFHNILSYQLTGLVFYRRQLAQNVDAVLCQLEKRGFAELIQYIRFLLADLEVGPAIMEAE